ncbi:MAG TPA: DUF6266 family protein [Mariniphaga sp.]|nr:DUF6266 family protein [Mariniphaga sp.]
MGKINQGIYGGVSGKVGNLIGASWKGINYLRIKPANVANPRTPKQLDQRSKFSLMLKFLQPLNEVIKVGYKSQAIKMTPINSALSYNIKNAIEGEYPEYSVDFENAILSKGALAQAAGAEYEIQETGKIFLSWTDNSDDPNASGDDKALLVVYNPVKNQAVTSKTVTRADCSGEVQLPVSFEGDPFHAWIIFQSADEQVVSESTYVGEGVYL